MPKPKTKTESFYMSMTSDQKTTLQAYAKLHGKSLFRYLIDAGLSINLDRSKINFYRNIQDDLRYIKQSLYVLNKLNLLVASEQEDQDFLMSFAKKAMEDAERHFRE